MFPILPRLRGKLSHKLLNFLIHKRIDNSLILKFSFRLYALLNWQRYTNTHRDERAHFIPKFLLKNFQSLQKGLLYKYETGKPVSLVSIKKTARIKNFYTFMDKNKKPSDFLEKELFANLIENYTPAILNRIETHNFPLTSIEESILAAFISSLYIRTPKFRKQLSGIIHYLIIENNVNPKDFKDINFIEAVFMNNKYNLNLKKLLNFLRNSKVKMIVSDNLLIAATSRLLEMANKLFFSKYLTFFQVQEPEFLFICDNPVFAINLVNKNPLAGPMLWELKQNSFVALPFSPHTAVIYSDKDLDLNSDKNKIAIYNLLRNIYYINRQYSVYADRSEASLGQLIGTIQRS